MDVQLKDRKQARLLIAKTGRSLRGFAKETGVSQAYLSQILSGKKKPSITVAYKIAEGLGLDVEEIFLVEVIGSTNH